MSEDRARRAADKVGKQALQEMGNLYDQYRAEIEAYVLPSPSYAGIVPWNVTLITTVENMVELAAQTPFMPEIRLVVQKSLQSVPELMIVFAQMAYLTGYQAGQRTAQLQNWTVVDESATD